MMGNGASARAQAIGALLAALEGLSTEQITQLANTAARQSGWMAAMAKAQAIADQPTPRPRAAMEDTVSYSDLASFVEAIGLPERYAKQLWHSFFWKSHGEIPEAQAREYRETPVTVGFLYQTAEMRQKPEQAPQIDQLLLVWLHSL